MFLSRLASLIFMLSEPVNHLKFGLQNVSVLNLLNKRNCCLKLDCGGITIKPHRLNRMSRKICLR